MTDVGRSEEVQWSADRWQTMQTVATRDTGLGLHVADLPTERLPVGATVAFRYGPMLGLPAESDHATYQVGIDEGAPGLHFYTLNGSWASKTVCERLGFKSH